MAEQREVSTEPIGRAKGSVGFSPGEGEPNGKSVVFSPSKQNGGAEENAMFSHGKENPKGNFTESEEKCDFIAFETIPW